MHSRFRRQTLHSFLSLFVAFPVAAIGSPGSTVLEVTLLWGKDLRRREVASLSLHL